VISSLNPAERAAIGGLPSGQEEQGRPALVSEASDAPEENRFPGLEESRFPGQPSDDVESSEATSGTENPAPGEPSKPNGEALTEQELREVDELQRRDLEVKAHERAHLSAAGQYARGGMKLSYTTGPDGRRYATSGEVGIDLSEGPNPEVTVAKMQTLRRAALAPANPSGADRAVAAAASQKEQAARLEISEERQTERQELQENQRSTEESQRESEGVERASAVEVNEGAESFAGAQAVQPEVNPASKGSGIDMRNLDMGQELIGASAQVETARAVEAPMPDRAPTPKRAVMRTPEESPEPPPEPEPETTEAE
jgi:hypothetical protein